MLARSGDIRIGWTRWLRAQEYEQGFWERLGRQIEAGTQEHLDWYAWRARRLESRLESLEGGVARSGKVLEIGSGPIGIVNFLEWGDRYALDPLEDFYRRQPALVRLRRPGATYLAGTGEQLPLEDASCALVIIDNVIDHTYAPGRILGEIHRVLAADGCLYLSVNVHTKWGALLHSILAVLQIDKGHPYTFTSGSLRRLLARSELTVVAEHVEDYQTAAKADRRAPGLRARVKGYTGLSEFSHAVLCRKNGAARPAGRP